jgi:hypothetical protein
VASKKLGLSPVSEKTGDERIYRMWRAAVEEMSRDADAQLPSSLE